MKASEKWIYRSVFLTLALLRGEFSASGSGRFASGEKVPSTHWIGGWVVSRNVDEIGNLTLNGI
jgi:hypothetical protein